MIYKKIIFFIIIIASNFILTTCSKENEEEREYPRVNTFEVTDITDKGATFSGNIFYAGNQEIIDHGFIWGQNKLSLSIQNASILSLGASNGPIEFTANINYGLAKNKEYFVTAYARTKDYTVYGTVTSFKSLGSDAPIIVDFEPKNAGWRDTVIVKLKNFSKQLTSTKLYIGSVLAPNFAFTDSTITTVVPPSIKSLKNILRIEFDGNTNIFTNDTLELIKPTINGFSPISGYQGDTITIYGNYLDNIRYLETNYVKLDKWICQTVAIYKDSIRICIPSLYSIDNSLTIKINDFVLSSPTQFSLLTPKIDDFKPKVATWNDELTIYGRFNTSRDFSSIYINGIIVPYTFYSKDSIKVKVPSELNTTFSTIKYKTTIYTINTTQTLQLTPPSINSVTANQKFSGSSITISGNYFKNGVTSVSINNVAAQIYSCTPNTIVAKIPSLPNELLTVSVTVAGQTATFNSNISLENPAITSFTPNTATFGDTIYIHGDFLDKINMVRLMNLNTLLNIAYISKNLIKVTIPNNTTVPTREIKLIIQYQDYHGINRYYELLSNENFTLAAPAISSISPESGNGEQEVRLTGSNFNPDKNYIEVFVGNSKATILSANKNEINIELNKLTNGAANEVKLVMNGYFVNTGLMYDCTSPWSEINGLPFHEMIIGSFSISNKGYTITYDHYDYNFSLRSFDPESNSWSTLSVPPKTSSSVNHYNVESFEVDGKIYFLQGSNRIDYFDIESGTWIQANNFPENFDGFSFSFKINNRIYLGIGKTNFRIWEYTPETDSWLQKGEVSDALESEFVATDYLRRSTMSVNGKGYIITNEKSVWEYTPESDTWLRKNDFPGQNTFYSSNLSFDNKAYIIGGCSSGYTPFDENWEYDPVSDLWTQKTSTPSVPTYRSLNFLLNNEIYFGGGTTSGWYEYRSNFYKYNPTLEK